MPILMNGKRYYRTTEACKIAGISRSTFFRWLRVGSFQDVTTFDRRGWRLFTQNDLRRLKKEANRISLNSDS
ncbi:MerR family transcriptional regulator [Chloroflexota bacterium]